MKETKSRTSGALVDQQKHTPRHTKQQPPGTPGERRRYYRGRQDVGDQGVDEEFGPTFSSTENLDMRSLALLLTTLTLLPSAGVQGQFPTQEDPRSLLTVTGTAEVQAEPDRARISFAVESEGTSAQEAGELNARAMASVSDALRSEGEGTEGFRLETSGYSLTPRYGAVRADRSREIVGYTARNTIQVTLDDLEPVGTLIDAALDAGANRVANLRFEVRDPEPYRHEAVREAVRMAHAEASVMAEALGVVLGPPVDVQGGAEMPYRSAFAMEERSFDTAEAVTTPINAGLQSVSARVTIRFRLDEGP